MSKHEPLSRRSFLSGRRLFGRLLDTVREADLERAAADVAEARLEATPVRQPRQESPAPWARPEFDDDTFDAPATTPARAGWRPTTRNPFSDLEPSE